MCVVCSYRPINTLQCWTLTWGGSTIAVFPTFSQEKRGSLARIQTDVNHIGPYTGVGIKGGSVTERTTPLLSIRSCFAHELLIFQASIKRFAKKVAKMLCLDWFPRFRHQSVRAWIALQHNTYVGISYFFQAIAVLKLICSAKITYTTWNIIIGKCFYNTVCTPIYK